MNTTKRPCLASYFSREAHELANEVRAAFNHPTHGPFAAKTRVNNDANATNENQQQLSSSSSFCSSSSFFSALVPHGAACDGFVVASHSYLEFQKFYFGGNHDAVHDLPTTIILVGNSHRPLGPASPVVLSSETWTTPLGSVPVDEEICSAIHQHARVPIHNNAHRQEHSIENQLPFLQMIYTSLLQQQRKSGTTTSFSIVPILVANDSFSSVSEIESIAERIAQAIIISCDSAPKKHNAKKFALIGTTDFSHVGPFYREVPPRGQSIVDYTTQRDSRVIRELLEMDLDKFVALGTKTSACGIWSAVMSVLLTNKLRRGRRQSKEEGDAKAETVAVLPRLLKYAVASEIFERPDVTGFGAFLL